MNIKSLLLGSAAALVAVSGARAADAVVMVEPEPVEYVRVCDVYGTGFFYIPGTETCLKIGGYVRMRLIANDEEFNNDPDDVGAGGDFEDTSFTTRVRARLDFDAREETELGTLRAKIRVQATNRGRGADTNGTGDFTMEEAFIQLGGLTMGQLDSVWTGEDGGIGDGLFTDTDWASGDFQQNRISYTYAASGFSGTLSVEDDGDGDFVPDVLAKLAYTGGFGGAYLMGVYDEDSGDFGTTRFGTRNGIRSNVTFFTDEFDTAVFNADTDEEAFALKAGVMLENLIAEDSAFKIEGHYAFDPTVYATVGALNGSSGSFRSAFGGASAIPSEYQIGAGYQQQFGKLFAAVSGVYGETFDLNSTQQTGFVPGTVIPVFTTFVDVGQTEYYGAALNVGYDITSNFSVLGEISYRDLDLPAGIDDFDQTAGFIEFKRSF